jgi:aldehyde dehydrogenase (NAD+)
VRTHDSFLIGSTWRPAASDIRLDVISPSTEEVVGRIPESTPTDIDAAVMAAREAFDHGPWPRMSVTERAVYFEAFLDVLRSRLDEAIHLQVDEMGGPTATTSSGIRAVIDSTAREIGIIDDIPKRMVRDGTSGKVLVTRSPIGVIGTIIPWNGPIQLILNRMVAAVMTGSALVLKPAPESPLTAYLLGEAVIAAGFPDGLISFVPGGREVGEYLVTHPGVDKISFTGSTFAGRRVASLCGQNLKPATLELGGKSAAILLDDIDLDRYMAAIIGGSMSNTGQICHATTRILVPRSRSTEIADRFVAEVSARKVGDPHDPSTFFGPLVAQRQRDRVEGFIQSGKDAGATIALGGGRPPGFDRGWYVEPTLFVGVNNSMDIAREEIFGPVLSLIEYDSVDEAVEIANDSRYGLGGAVYTDDLVRGLEIAGRMHTGSCAVNGGPPGGGGGPFGGVKESGLGRERGIEGYESYFELKSISVPSGAEVPE